MPPPAVDVRDLEASLVRPRGLLREVVAPEDFFEVRRGEDDLRRIPEIVEVVEEEEVGVEEDVVYRPDPEPDPDNLRDDDDDEVSGPCPRPPPWG